MSKNAGKIKISKPTTYQNKRDIDWRNLPEIDDKTDGIGWNMLVDFTDNGKTRGAPIEDVLKALHKLNKGGYGQDRKISKKGKSER